MPLPVLQALLRELGEARNAKGLTQRQMQDEFGLDERKLTGFENLRRAPTSSKIDPGDGVAEVVEVYSRATGRSPFELWSAALARAEDERAKYEAWLEGGRQGPHPLRPGGERSKSVLDELRPQPDP